MHNGRGDSCIQGGRGEQLQKSRKKNILFSVIRNQAGEAEDFKRSMMNEEIDTKVGNMFVPDKSKL